MHIVVLFLFLPLLFLSQDGVMLFYEVQPQYPVACARRRFANEIEPKISFKAQGSDLWKERLGCISFFYADSEKLCNQNIGIISRLPRPHLGAFRHQAHLLAHALVFNSRALLDSLPYLKQAFGGPQP